MNYPIWQLPASGLLIAVVAILHVFVSHFAVGGGLFLVVTERKARREGDDALLDYVRRHSRFFVLLTIVFGAVSGVGIWFTIGLVHPAATSALINAYVWGWAIEWTFFLTEIAAALVYFYGWYRLTAKQHMIVGWIYFAAAWASLAIINGILTFMLTPGRWLETHGFWNGFFNPTYWPALVVRTLGAAGLAGVYALFTASWIASPELQRKLARYATAYWIVPMAIGIPLAYLWLLSAAAAAGVPVAQMLAIPAVSAHNLTIAAWGVKSSGYPIAQRALMTMTVAVAATVVLALITLALKQKALMRTVTAGAMLAALTVIGAAEWVREDLRKPFIIGQHMFVNSVRLPAPAGTLAARSAANDEYEIGNVSRAGVLAVSRWVAPRAVSVTSAPTIAQEAARGREVFTVLCSQCHTLDGYLAVRPLVAGKSSSAIERVLDNLALPRDSAGREAAWSSPGVQLVTWRNRRMPPFAGTDEEKHALAVYLATVGGGQITPAGGAAAGGAAFDKYCGVCHAADSGIPIGPRVAGRSELEIYSLLDHLPQLNEAMPPFDGTEAERHALASHLAQIAQSEGGNPR